MNRINCDVSNMISLKSAIFMRLSRGASMQVTKSSKYSVTPLNVKLVRTRRAERVEGGGSRLARSGQDRGDLNPRERCSMLVNVERTVTIASGGKYPE